MRIDRLKFVTELTKQDLTLIELSKRSGVNRVTLSNVKCGKACREDIAQKVAKALNIDLEKLIEK